MVSSVLHLISTSLPTLLSYFLFSNTNHILLYTFLHLLLHPATSNSSSLTPLFSIFHHVLLPVHHDVTRSLLPSTPHPLVHIPFLLSTLTLLLSATHSPVTFYSCLLHLLYYSNYIFILASCFFIFSTISTSGPSTTTSCILQIQLSFINTWFSLSFLHLFSSLISYLIHLPSPSLFLEHALT